MLLQQSRSFLPRFYRLAGVGILSNMMIPLAGLCDTAFLGHLHDLKYLAGVILGSILFDYLYRILKFLRNSTNAITSQAAGKGDEEEVILAVLRNGSLAIIIGLLLFCLQYPIQKIGFAILAGSKDIELAGVEYFNARIYGAPAVLLNFVLLGWLMGTERKRLVLLVSLIANGSNVLLDYLMIYRWGWESTGAGLATALSQYLAATSCLFFIFIGFKGKNLVRAWSKVWNYKAFKSSVSLNVDILVRFLCLISAYSIFTNISASINAELLAENGLLLQIALLSQFTIQGIGMSAQTLIGKFKGRKETRKLVSVLSVAIIHSLPIAISFALSTLLFPETIFGILSSHEQINQGIVRHTPWLIPLLSFTAVAFMFEAYFIGLKKGNILRNASLTAFLYGFFPIAITAWYFKNVDLLWLSLVLYMFFIVVYLGRKIFIIEFIPILQSNQRDRTSIK